MAINFTWVPPSVANGVISSYNICLSRDPLNEQEEPAVDVFRDCDAIVEVSSLTYKNIIFINVRAYQLEEIPLIKT